MRQYGNFISIADMPDILMRDDPVMREIALAMIEEMKKQGHDITDEDVYNAMQQMFFTKRSPKDAP